jgi:hypothetical protein
MMGDPYGRIAGRATLLVRAMDGILGTHRNKHPSTNNILRLPGSQLVKASARPGDLLVATEGSARTIAVRCANTCTVRYIAADLSSAG